MNKALLLFTNKYPFGDKDAPFLTKELEYLNRDFATIVLVPYAADLSDRLVTNKYEIDTSLVGYLGRLKLTPNLVNDLFIKNILPAVAKQQLARLKKIMWTLSVAANVSDWVVNKVGGNSTTILYSYWFTSVAAGLALSKDRGVNLPMVARAHGGDLYEDTSYANFFPLRNYTLQHLDRIFLISEDGLAHISDRYPKYIKKFELSRLGVAGPSPVSTTSKKPLSLSIVSCSYLRPGKRVEMICDILSTLANQHPEFNLYWNHFGGGDPFETEKVLTKSRLFPENIQYKMWGTVANQTIIEFYKNTHVDFFISTSISEGIPVSMMEALSFGIPIISTNVGGVKELVSHDNGILFDVNVTIDQAVRDINNLLDNPNISQIRASARDTWNRKYNAENNYSLFSSRLIEIINDGYVGNLPKARCNTLHDN